MHNVLCIRLTKPFIANQNLRIIMMVAKISSISGSGFCIARSSPSAFLSNTRSIRFTSDTTAAALKTERS